MVQVTYCLMCLGTQVKMYQMNSSMLTIYNELILSRYKLSIKNMHACYECAYLLHKYAKFKAKCCKAYNILWNLSPGSFEVTEEYLRSIDRKQNKLESSLTRCISTAYYQPTLDDQLMPINAQKVKRESSMNSIEEQCNKITLQSQEKLALPIIVTTTYYNNDQLENSESYTEFKSDVNSTPEHDLGDDYQSVDILEAENSNCNLNKESAAVITRRCTKQDTDNESVEVCDYKANLASPIKLDIECFENNSDYAILEKYPVTVNIENKVSKTMKREFVVQNENIIYSNEKNNSSNDFIKSLELISGVDDKPIMKKKAKIIGNQSPKVPVKNKKDCRLTLDSSFFRDHVTIIKLTPEDARCELLLRKESRNYKMNSHKCLLCYRGFISEATYEAHMKKHSLEYGLIKCDICQLTFNENRSLSRHWSMCHTWKLLCKTCPYMCFNINQAKSHIQSHKGKKYTCKDCGESFRFPNSLSTHMRLKHSIELVCEFCGSTFASAQGMDCHKRLRHRKENNECLGPQCVECDVHFASELAWKRHRVLCSRHDVSNGCVVCGETFPNRVELRSHSREHGEPTTTAHSRSRKVMDYKPLPCELCKKELHSRKAYVKHMSIEHPQTDTDKRLTSKCVCEVCGRTFRHRSFLIAHQRKHTDEKPFSCPHCGKKFKNAYAVKMHLPMHTNEYTFKCHLCEKAFGDRGRLNRHVKGHLGIRPYKCSYCEKTFMFQCEERLHTKYVHCKEPYPKRDRRKRNAVKKEDIK